MALREICGDVAIIPLLPEDMKLAFAEHENTGRPLVKLVWEVANDTRFDGAAVVATPSADAFYQLRDLGIDAFRSDEFVAERPLTLVWDAVKTLLRSGSISVEDFVFRWSLREPNIGSVHIDTMLDQMERLPMAPVCLATSTQMDIAPSTLTAVVNSGGFVQWLDRGGQPTYTKAVVGIEGFRVPHLGILSRSPATAASNCLQLEQLRWLDTHSVIAAHIGRRPGCVGGPV